MSSFIGHFYFSVRGRTSRRLYWLFGFIPFVVGGFVAGLGLAIVAPQLPALVLMVLVVTLMFFCAWTGIAIHAKRFHDIGISAWWMLLVSVISLVIAWFVSYRAAQLTSLAVYAVVGLLPGTPGINRFGPDPTRLRRPDLEQSDVPAA